MATRLRLTLPTSLGSKEVEVDKKRFSIGRTPENDLVVDDSSLSRRHALIEDYDGVFNLSDCGSSNGTFINGQSVTSVAALHDWDVLTFGGVGDIVVRVGDESRPTESPGQSTGANAIAPPKYSATAISHNANHLTSREARSWLSAPVIAASAAVLILVIAGLVLLISKAGSSSSRTTKPGIARKQQRVSESDNNNQERNSPTPTETTSDPINTNVGSNGPDDAGSADLSAIEAAASKVLNGISKDTHPVLTEKPLMEINAQIQRYRNSPSSLRDELRAMKRDILQVSAAAKSNGIRAPMAVYATLAQIDKDGRGDPVQVAGQLCPALAKMRRIFGDELANDSLLTVAALEEGPSLQLRITRLAGRVNDSPTTIRSVWYLHEHQVISNVTYDFILRFMAIGVISQDPQKFGITAEPLTF